MNIPISITQVSKPEISGYDRIRLLMLDNFFELEIAVGKWCKLLGHSDANVPFGQRMKGLVADSNLNTVAPPGQAKYIRALPEKLEEILRIRNTVAHSRVKEGIFAGEATLFFEIAPHIFAGDGAVIPISLAKISTCALEAKQIANHLLNFIKQNAGAN